MAKARALYGTLSVTLSRSTQWQWHCLTSGYAGLIVSTWRTMHNCFSHHCNWLSFSEYFPAAFNIPFICDDAHANRFAFSNLSTFNSIWLTLFQRTKRVANRKLIWMQVIRFLFLWNQYKTLNRADLIWFKVNQVSDVNFGISI